MFRKLGWAAFLAFVTVTVTTGSGTALANGSRPTFACFSANNAAVIGRLGAADPSVRLGFEAGECLALPANLSVYDVERVGPLWRFRTMGAAPYLYAADWAAGFQPATGDQQGFERYLPVTGKLIEMGRGLVACYDATDAFIKRQNDFDRRWHAYWATSRTNVKSGLVHVIYFTDTQQKLEMERWKLMYEGDALNKRCEPYGDLDIDNDFVAFLRTQPRG